MDNIRGLETYMFELAKFQGSISTLLINLEKFIYDIPNKEFHNRLLEEFKDVLKELEEYQKNINSFITICNQHRSNLDSSSDETRDKLKEISLLIKDFNPLLDQDIKSIVQHNNNFLSKICDTLCEDNSDLRIQINKTSELTILLMKEIEKLKTVIDISPEDERINITDLQDVILFAKQGIKITRFLTSTKMKVSAIISFLGLILGFIYFAIQNKEILIQLFNNSVKP